MVSDVNARYGHRAILVTYMGAPPGTRLAGILQHGWHLGGERQATLTSPRIPYFAWADRHRLEEGQRCVTIGAPFLYLPDVRAGLPPAPPDHVLAVPYHGFGDDPDHVHERYAAFLEGMRSDANHVTVCLHPLEYRSPVRHTYASRGFDVTTNGEREDPRFLLRYLDLVRRHGTVTSNRISTALFLAAATGRRILIRGPLAHSPDASLAHLTVEEQYRLAIDTFGDLSDGVDGGEARALGWRELGGDYLRSPAELRRLTWADWPHQGLARLARSANGTRKVAARLRRPGAGR